MYRCFYCPAYSEIQATEKFQTRFVAYKWTRFRVTVILLSNSQRKLKNKILLYHIDSFLGNYKIISMLTDRLVNF